MENVVARDGDGDEELSLFLEMRRREKVQGVSSLPETGTTSVDKTSTKSLVPTTTRLPRSAVEKFLDSENNKSDYDWLLAAPDENPMVEFKEPKVRPTALEPRAENIPQEPLTCGVKASKPISRLQSSTAASKQAKPSSDKPSRQATPTSRTTKLTNSARNSDPANRMSSTPRPSAFTRSSSVGKTVPGAKYTSPTIPEKPTSKGRGYSCGERSMGRCKISNDVSPVLMGTQMVERIVNMRKLPPPKQDDKMSSSFGTSLSRSSLDMALRHMNIRRSVPGNLRVTINAPTNYVDKNKPSPSS